ncbi:hypothetical protein [Streptomyces synnematoformans]|uniref:HTH cro/C1-type domain-containing protein n=1 Tax=Streptomyces synnematoformans TaxID=415721 RepID=A0ABN2Y4R9_9ACTN
MGRRERPLDPADGPVARFACELREVRRKAGGVTYRELAARVHYSAATLAQAASGDRLPSLAVTLAYVDACGGDREEWERRWHEAAEEVAGEAHSDDDGARPPYLGLARFDTGDHDRFFGRDRLAGQLVELVGGKHLVVVTGPSGSGKSSLLRAGLIPRLRQAEPARERPAAIRILTPGPHPARTHADVLDPGAAPAGTVIVVDQFEEVFTLCTDRAERTRFLDLLCAAARPAHGLRVVIAVRGDFYVRLAQHRALAKALPDATLLVAPMSFRELREVVVRPAALVGLVVERTLTARIIKEVADEPGGLPLLSHALLETWRRRRGRVLTEAAYDAAGGIHGALAHTAEDLYRRLSADQAETARRILLRLVAPGQGGPDTRRPAARGELATLGPGDTAATAAVLDRLARARLITLDDDTVNLAHEAVLTGWPRLRQWIDDDRDRLRAQRHLTEAAHTWQSLDRDPGALYRGLRLSTAQEHFGTGNRDDRDDLAPPEREFLDSSLAVQRREGRQRRGRRAALSVLLVLSLVAALVAWQQSRDAERRRVETEARRVAGVADSLRASDPQTAMRLSLAAWHTADLPETRSALLAAAAQPEQDAFADPNGDVGTMRHLSADGRTLISAGAEEVARWDVDTHQKTSSLPGLGGRLQDVGALTADTRRLALRDSDNWRKIGLLDLTTGRRTGAPLGSASAGVETGPSGHSLVTYHDTGSAYRIRLWDTDSRHVLLELHRAHDPQEKDPAVRRTSGRQNLLGMQNRHSLLKRSLPDVTVSADDRFVALCTPGKHLEVWDVAERRRRAAPWAPKVSEQQCLSGRVQFTADGRRLALVTGKGIRIWEIASGTEVASVTHDGVESIGFSKDGEFVAAFDEAEIVLWRTEQPDAPVHRYSVLGESVSDIRISPKDGWIRYLGGPEGDWGTVVHTLTLRESLTAGWQEGVDKSAFSPDGNHLVTAQIVEKGSYARFRLRNIRTGKSVALPKMPCRASPPFEPYCDVLMAFSSDGDTLAYGVSEGLLAPGSPLHVSLWNIPERRTTASPDFQKNRSDPSVVDVAFGPDDASLLTSQVPGMGETHVWDVRRHRLVRTFPAINGRLALRPDERLLITSSGLVATLPRGMKPPGALSPGQTTALAFSQDGAYLAAGDASGRTVLWDGDLEQRLGVFAPAGEATSPYVTALAFSPDGRTLAVAPSDGALQLWDTVSHRPLGAPLRTPGDSVQALAFTPDGSAVYAAAEHTSPRRYEITPQHAARDVCRRVGEGLSPEEWQAHLPGISYGRTC